MGEKNILIQWLPVYMDYQDKSRAKERFSKFRMIWNDRDVVLVEGEKKPIGNRE